MGRDIPWLDDRIEDFVSCYWNTDVREDATSAFARASLRQQGIHDTVRRFLLDVIQRDAVTPNQWRDLCNVTVDSREDVRADALELWEWLFDGESLPGAGRPHGPLHPPQA